MPINFKVVENVRNTPYYAGDIIQKVISLFVHWYDYFGMTYLLEMRFKSVLTIGWYYLFKKEHRTSACDWHHWSFSFCDFI